MSGVSQDTWDFGLVPFGAVISDFVWDDLDLDGEQDALEPGIDGVTVNLLLAGAVVDTDVTAGGGFYTLGAGPGTYQVEIVVPGGKALTLKDATTDDKDSDADQTTAKTDPFVVASGVDQDTWDFGLVPMLDPPMTGLFWERWTGIPGSPIVNLTSNVDYPASPDITTMHMGDFEIPGGNNLGDRVRGFVIPTVTDTYTFWTASDNQSQVFLSSDANPANLINGGSPIAMVPFWTIFHQWNKFPEQMSATVALTAGKAYYIEALHKNDSRGSGHWSVGWSRVGDPNIFVIPQANLWIWKGIGDIHIEKVTVPADPGGTSYGFTHTIPDGVGTFSLTDGDSAWFTAPAGVTFTVTEDDPGPVNFLDTLTCDIAAGSGSVPARTATITLADGDAVTCTYTNMPTNTPPVVTTSFATTPFIEDGGAVTVDSALVLTDDGPTIASATVMITNLLDTADETLACPACAGLGILSFYLAPTLNLIGPDTVVDFEAALKSVEYNNLDHDPDTTTRTIKFVANDGLMDSGDALRAVSVAALNDAPEFDIDTIVASFTEDGGPTNITSTVQITDPDDTNLASAMVTISNVQDAGDEQLTATGCGTLVVVGSGTATLSITGNEPIANYVTCLTSVRYEHVSQNPTQFPQRGVTFMVSDSEPLSASSFQTISVIPVNDKPVVTPSAGSTAFTEGGGPVTVDGAVTVTDVDDTLLDFARVTITNQLDGTDETLAATASGGIVAVDITYTAATGILLINPAADQSLADFQAVLQSVAYDNASLNPDTTTRLLSFLAGDGTDFSIPSGKNVTIGATNTAPVVTTSGGSSAFTEDDGAITVDGAVTVTDVDDTTLDKATVTITNQLDGTDETLAATASGGIVAGHIIYVAATGILTIDPAVEQSLADFIAVLQSVTYDNANQDPDTTSRVIRFVANDTTLASADADKTVTVAALNDAPVVTTSGGSSAFTEAAGAITVDGSVTVTDVDDTTLDKATVTITNQLDGTDETFAASASGGIAAGDIVYVAATGILTIDPPAEQTLADFNAVLQSVMYDNADVDPDETDRVIRFVANDTTLASNNGDKTVTVTAVNSPPLGVTDNYTTAVGNTMLVVGAATAPATPYADESGLAGVLGNDTDPEGNTPIAIDSVDTTGLGGTLSMNLTTGDFTFLPDAGFSGATSFTYIPEDSLGLNGTATTVNITVGTVVWYIDDVISGTNPAGGDGRSTDPFDTVAAFNSTAADAVGDVIFLYNNATGGTYTTGLTLLDDQKVIGQGFALATEVPGITGNAPAAGANPSLTATGDGITLAEDNTIRGLDIGNTTGGYGITDSGSMFGTLTVGDVRIFGVGGILDLASGTLAASFDSLNSSSGSTIGINLSTVGGSLTVADTGGPAADVNIIGASTVGIEITGAPAASSFTFADTRVFSSTAGIDLSSSSSATFNFDDVVVTTTAGTGLRASSAGTVNIGGATQTISAVGGPALDVTSTTVGAGGWSFTSLTSTGSTGRGINLDSLGASAVISGGTTMITSATDESIRLKDLGGASLDIDFGTTTITTRKDTGILLDNVDGGAVDFGATSIPGGTGGGYGIRVEDGSAAVTFLSTTISSTTKTVSETRGVSDFPSNDGDGDAIFLKDNTGLFTITGAGTDGSGGSITSAAGDGVDIRTSSGVTLNDLIIDAPAYRGIQAVNLTGTSLLDNVEIRNITDGSGVGENVNAVWVANNGTASLTSFTADNSTFESSSTAQSYFLVENYGTGTMTVDVEDSVFTDLFNIGLQGSSGQGSSTGTINFSVERNEFKDGKLDTTSGGAPPCTVGNPCRGSNTLTVTVAFPGATMNMTVEDNQFHNISKPPTSLSGQAAIPLNAVSGGTLSGTFNGNQIYDIGRSKLQGVQLNAGSIGAAATVDVTFDGNFIDNVSDQIGLQVRLEDDATDSEVVISNNTIGLCTDPDGAGTVFPAPTPCTVGNVGGPTRDGVFIQTRDGSMQLDVLIEDNVFRVDSTGQVVDIDIEDGTKIEATVLGNTFTNMAAGGVNLVDGFDMEIEDPLGAACLDLNAANVLADSNTSNLGYQIEIDDMATLFEIEGLGSNGNAAAVETFLGPKNSGTVDAIEDGELFLAVTGCDQPS